MKTKLLSLYACIFLLLFFSVCKKNTGEASAGFTTEEFINYSLDGNDFAYEMPGDTLRHVSNTNESPTLNESLRINCSASDANYTLLSFSRNGIGLNSQQKLAAFGATAVFGSSNFLFGDMNVLITEYGAIGEYIAGNFTGSLAEVSNQSVIHSISCSFRVKRIQ